MSVTGQQSVKNKKDSDRIRRIDPKSDPDRSDRVPHGSGFSQHYSGVSLTSLHRYDRRNVNRNEARDNSGANSSRINSSSQDGTNIIAMDGVSDQSSRSPLTAAEGAATTEEYTSGRYIPTGGGIRSCRETILVPQGAYLQSTPESDVYSEDEFDGMKDAFNSTIKQTPTGTLASAVKRLSSIARKKTGEARAKTLQSVIDQLIVALTKSEKQHSDHDNKRFRESTPLLEKWEADTSLDQHGEAHYSAMRKAERLAELITNMATTLGDHRYVGMIHDLAASLASIEEVL
uniref:Uncharacterized protein n=1 Tax=Anopheles atroparvus TaxID=41427 RepID=A0A182ITT8_ANOAO